MCLRVLSLALCLLFTVGCAKRTAKNTAPSKDDSVSAKPQPTPAAGDKNKKGAPDDSPNWRALNDMYVERFGPEASTMGPPEGHPSA